MCRDLSELKAFQGLDRNSLVKQYSIEPCKITYIIGSSQYKYIPDLLVTYKDNKKKLIEIKSFKRSLDFLSYDSALRAKLKAGIDYAVAQGIEFELWTYKSNAKRFDKKIFGSNELLEKLKI